MNSISKIPKTILDFIGYSNLFLALAVFCSTIQGGFIFDHVKEPALWFSVLNFIAAFFLYNLQRIYQSSLPTTDPRLLWYRKNKKWIFTIAIVMALGFTEITWTIFRTYKEGIFVYGFCALFSVFYFLPPLNLRKVAYLKQFYIALVWIMVCVVIPFLFEEEHFTGWMYFQKDQWLYIVSQFCFIAALCIPFDIRDIDKDAAEGTQSLPVVLGEQKSKYTAYALLCVYLVLAFFIETKNLILIRGFVFIAGCAVVYFSNKKRHRYYFIYLADGVIILQTLLLIFLL